MSRVFRGSLYSNEDGEVSLSPTPKRGSYKFTGWNTKADGTGTPYDDAAASVDVSALAPEYKLYAQWKPYTLTLVKDGGYEVFTNATGTGLPGYDSSAFTRDGFTLFGWYTAPNDSGTMALNANGGVVADVDGYSDLGQLALTGDQTLYACWYRPERYVQTETLEDDRDYLLVSTDNPHEPTETSVAFGQEVYTKRGENQKNQKNVEVTVQKDAFNKKYIAQTMPSYAVFHASQADGSEGYYLKNGLGYLNVDRNTSNPGENFQYSIDTKKANTAWLYFGSSQYEQTYNQNVLINKQTDWEENPGQQTKWTRRFTYTGRLYLLHDQWSPNGFTVKASKDQKDDANTNVYLYKKEPARFEFSDDTVSGSAMAAMYSARTVAPAENAALTLMDGIRTVLSTAVPSGAAPVTGYTAPTRINSEWTLEGWYTSKDGTGTKVLNADGTVAGDGLWLSGDATLYACWTRETDIFVKTDTLEPDADYLLVLGSGEETRAVGQVGETVVRQPVTAYEPGDGGYEVYDAETGDWSHVDSPYINVFSDQTVWHYAVDGEGNGTLTAVDGSARNNALWELKDSDISIYRRTTVRERSFEDEYLMLTLCTGTDCVTEVVTVADGAWSDAWSAVCRKLESGWLWFDSPNDGSGVQVLNVEGRFAAENVVDYVKDGRWVYDGGSLALYARTPELPEAEPMDAMLLTTETEEDKKKRTPRKIRIDGMKV